MSRSHLHSCGKVAQQPRTHTVLFCSICDFLRFSRSRSRCDLTCTREASGPHLHCRFVFQAFAGDGACVCVSSVWLKAQIVFTSTCPSRRSTRRRSSFFSRLVQGNRVEFLEDVTGKLLCRFVDDEAEDVKKEMALPMEELQRKFEISRSCRAKPWMWCRTARASSCVALPTSSRGQE